MEGVGLVGIGLLWKLRVLKGLFRSSFVSVTKRESDTACRLGRESITPFVGLHLFSLLYVV